MKDKRQASEITTLYYRLYVTFFEANADILKVTNRYAFYWLSIFDEETLIAEMVEGINPVILADKIFLNNAVLNFSHLVSKPALTVRLRSHHGMNEFTVGQADLNLQRINDNYFQFSQRFNSLQSIIFSSQKGHLKLIFNIFVQKNKVDLDLYIKKFKQNQKEIMRAKRYIATKKKIEAEQKANNIENIQNILQRQRSPPTKQENSVKVTYQSHQREDSISKSTKHKKTAEVVSSNNINHLQINSAARFRDIKGLRIQDPKKNVMNQIEQKELHAYSSHMESFQNSKILSYDIGSTSIISDGSEQSQMINSHLTQTYSERAVTKFRQKTYKCINITVLILVFCLLYLLLAPSAKIEKKVKNKSRIKISKIAQDLIDI